jgi:hypothetical protein
VVTAAVIVRVAVVKCAFAYYGATVVVLCWLIKRLLQRLYCSALMAVEHSN